MSCICSCKVASATSISTTLALASWPSMASCSAACSSSTLAMRVRFSASFFAVTASTLAFHCSTSFFWNSTARSMSDFSLAASSLSFCASLAAVANLAATCSCSARISSAFLRTASSMPSPAMSAARRAASTVTVTSLTVHVVSTRMARAANSSVLTVSWQDSMDGLQHTRRLVLQLPPTESSRMRVSFESRKGTCFFLSARACTTLPKASSEALMLAASLSPAPVTPLRLTRSDPARSTTVSLPMVACIFTAPPPALASVARGRLAILIWNTECERLDALFILVSA
mmetsp:Transcript_8480/g.16060  ORF Transcript_8480/g.16060 Transcript_8480/m.16060 type:complete len:287 (-) Transcript_8480:423-1283(-)